MSPWKRLLLWIVPPEPEPEPVEPSRPDYPCGVSDCLEPQVVIRADGKYLTVECPVHLCVTSWEIAKRELREQKVIRVQDNWRQHGTKGPPK